jgi:UDP-N-acetylmuramate: L-alanyl-gamma-D-glutamyl-meso-diaminopimelate ligase
MKLGAMKAQLPWSLEHADHALCHAAGLGWDAAAALAPMGERASVVHTIDDAVTQLVRHTKAGDHVLCMSNGGFGGLHQRLLEALM